VPVRCVAFPRVARKLGFVAIDSLFLEIAVRTLACFVRIEDALSAKCFMSFFSFSA
jgi:hypothetical protein